MVGQKDNCFIVNQVTRISGQTMETKKDQKQGQKNVSIHFSEVEKQKQKFAKEKVPCTYSFPIFSSSVLK